MSSFRAVVLLVIAILLVAAATTQAAKQKRVLIIGSGINGAAVAAFLEDLHLRDPSSSKSIPGRTKYNITVAEKSDRIGGRVFGFQDESAAYMELGASVYHNINVYMSIFADHAAAHLGLQGEAQHRTHPYNESRVGVFDGKAFTFQEASASQRPWWVPEAAGWLWEGVVTAYRAFFRFGAELFRVPGCIDKRLVDRLNGIYALQGTGNGRQQGGAVFLTAEALLGKLNLRKATEMSFVQFLGSRECKGQGTDPVLESNFFNELAFALCRLNYGQDPIAMTALGAGVAMKGKGSDVFAFRGGNYRIIKSLFELTRSSVLLNTEATVTTTTTTTTVDGTKKRKILFNGDRDVTADFDLVFVAHPLWDLDNQGQAKQAEQQQPILPGHVTHVTIVEARELNPRFFGEKDGDEMTLSIIITSRPVLKMRNKVFFRSIGRLRSSSSSSTSGKKSLFKIFSDEQLSEGQLADSGVFKGFERIVKQHEWRAAYPKLVPPLPQEPTAAAAAPETKFLLAPGVFYAGALEKFVSTLETQSISARNAVLLATKYLSADADEASSPPANDATQEMKMETETP